MTTPPPTLRENDQKEVISFAYLSAISALAGYNCQPGPAPDRNSVDAIVWPGEGMLNINVQLKSTASPDWQEDGLHFRLRRKNYDELRTATLPAILVVLELPEDEESWFECDSDNLIMRRCAWWLSLKEHPEIDTQSRVVTLPMEQRLDIDELKRLMGLASQGRL